MVGLITFLLYEMKIEMVFVATASMEVKPLCHHVERVSECNNRM